MAKKLTVEVDAETTKAKRKIQELAETGGSSAGADAVGGAAQRAARSLDNAAGAANRLSKSTTEGSAQLRSMVKVFGGMAIRMGASYAASNMEAGSKGQMAVKGLGDVAGGAITGAAFGPLGAVAGGLMGLTSALMEATQAEKDRVAAAKSARADFDKGEREYAEAKEWEAKLKGLSKIDKGFSDYAGRISLVNDELSKLRDEESYTVRSIKFHIANSKRKPDMMATANEERSSLAANRARQGQLVALLERLETESKKASKPEARASMDALDSLARVGGNFAGSDAGFRDLQRVNEKQVALLEKIEAKTGKGSGTF